VVPILHPSTIPPSHFSTTCPSPLSPRHPTQHPLSLLHHPAFTSPHTSASHDSTTPPLSPLDTTPPAQCPPITLPLSLLHHPAQPSPPPSRPLIPKAKSLKFPPSRCFSEKHASRAFRRQRTRDLGPRIFPGNCILNCPPQANFFEDF
jgi:hypothetical protein